MNKFRQFFWYIELEYKIMLVIIQTKPARFALKFNDIYAYNKMYLNPTKNELFEIVY